VYPRKGITIWKDILKDEDDLLPWIVLIVLSIASTYW